jgi:RNA polymerase sigma-70 factor (ECF subfamily)
LREFDLQDQDAEDITQNVMEAVFRKIGTFSHRHRVGSFRNWLRKLTSSRVMDFYRDQGRQRSRGLGEKNQELIDQLADENSEISIIWNRQHDRYLVSQLIKLVEPCFSEKSLMIFKETFIQGKSITEVANERGMTENAVSVVKSRVLSAIRTAGLGLIELNDDRF